jgi:branched-chain amino acid transport system substrate-binding protein
LCATLSRRAAIAAARQAEHKLEKTPFGGRTTGHCVIWRGIASVIGGAAMVTVGFAAATAPASAQSGEPIKIGFSMALNGALPPTASKLSWAPGSGSKKPVPRAVCSVGLPSSSITTISSKPAAVPEIYTKLLDVDKVDLVVRPYATNMNAPAMPVVMQKGRTFISLFALGLNCEFNYPKYFSMLPTGPDTKPSFSDGFFQAAAAQKPKPATVALASEDAEFDAQRLRRRPRQCKKIRLHDHLRQDLPAEHDQLLADRPGVAGRQCRPRGGMLLSAELGRHCAVRQ